MLYRAKQSGLWDDITTWEVSNDNGITWADATQLPTLDDDVWTNSFTISLPAGATSIYCHNLSNKEDVDKGIVVGGKINVQDTSGVYKRVYANKISSQDICFQQSNNGRAFLSIQCSDIEIDGNFYDVNGAGNNKSPRLIINCTNIIQHSGYLIYYNYVGTTTDGLINVVVTNYYIYGSGFSVAYANYTAPIITITANYIYIGTTSVLITGQSGSNKSISADMIEFSFYARPSWTSSGSIAVDANIIINPTGASAVYSNDIVYKFKKDNILYVEESSITPDYPQEANVLLGVSYDNGNKTGTYNVSISPADIIAALAMYGTAKASDLSGLSTLTIADITSALTTYGTAKGSDLSGLSTLTLADIATALSNYGTAKTSDLSGLSTLTSNDILQALATYTAVKVSDLIGISISQQDVVDALTTYGASKVSDLSSALNTYGAAKTSDLSGLSTLTLADIATALTNYSVAKTSDLSGLSTLTASDISNALANYGAAKSNEIENVVKEEYLSEILGE